MGGAWVLGSICHLVLAMHSQFILTSSTNGYVSYFNILAQLDQEHLYGGHFMVLAKPSMIRLLPAVSSMASKAKKNYPKSPNSPQSRSEPSDTETVLARAY